MYLDRERRFSNPIDFINKRGSTIFFYFSCIPQYIPGQQRSGNNKKQEPSIEPVNPVNARCVGSYDSRKRIGKTGYIAYGSTSKYNCQWHHRIIIFRHKKRNQYRIKDNRLHVHTIRAAEKREYKNKYND